MIFKQINSTYRCDPNRYYKYGLTELGSNVNQGVLHILHSSKIRALLLNAV